MSLKVAQMTYANQFGLTQTVFLTWGGLDIKWRESAYVRFNVYASSDDATRGLRMDVLHLPISQAQVEEMLMIEGYVGHVVSERSWQLAQETAFIADFSEIDSETNQRIPALKSLTDLSAQIIEVEL